MLVTKTRRRVRQKDTKNVGVLFVLFYAYYTISKISFPSLNQFFLQDAPIKSVLIFDHQIFLFTIICTEVCLFKDNMDKIWPTLNLFSKIHLFFRKYGNSCLKQLDERSHFLKQKNFKFSNLISANLRWYNIFNTHLILRKVPKRISFNEIN